MNADKLFNVIAGITTLAVVTTIVARPNSANVIRAFGDAWSGALRAAMGK